MTTTFGYKIATAAITIALGIGATGAALAQSGGGSNNVNPLTSQTPAPGAPAVSTPGTTASPMGTNTAPKPSGRVMASPNSTAGARTAASGYATEAAAKSACGSDTVVWGNTSSKVFHMSGNKYYGHTSHGSYMCEKQATAGGYHAAKGG